MPQILSVKEQIQQINILYIALFAGQMILALVIIFLMNQSSTVESETASTVDSSWTLIAAMISVSAIGLAFFLYNKRKEEGTALSGGLASKLAHYRVSFTLRAALIESANMVAILFYFMEGNIFYLILFAVGIAAFLLIRPSVPKIIEDYQLSASEQSEFQNALN